MKRITLVILLLLCFRSLILANGPIQMHEKGYVGNHAGLPIVFADQPDVYFDNATMTIIINGGGEVSYYDVEIAPTSTFVPVISTQVNGYDDTIDISSLPQGLYCITIYSPEDNTYEGFFEIE